MKYIETHTTDPAENLAYEAYFLERGDLAEPILMIWRNRPTVVVGANQNTLKEVDIDFLKREGIALVRRTSGGGAVYHDLGNLCFSFIRDVDDVAALSFADFLRPVKRVLDRFGLDVDISGRNDLLLDGKKISGSAARIEGNCVLFHGTLLYSTDLSILARALTVSREKLALKGAPSVRSRVTLIADHLDDVPPVDVFKARLVESFRQAYGAVEYVVTEEEKEGVLALADARYRNDAWTIGKNPPSNAVFRRRFPLGELGVEMMIRDQRIESIRFEGDFLSWLDAGDVAGRLTGLAYDRNEIDRALAGFETDENGHDRLALYFGGLSRADILSVIMADHDFVGGNTNEL